MGRSKLASSALFFVAIAAAVYGAARGGSEPAVAKVTAPEHLVVFLDDATVVIERAELETWLADAAVVPSQGLAVRPDGAADAVAMWSPDARTPSERVAWAVAEKKRGFAGWWSPEGAGGVLLLRGDFSGGVSPIGPAQEIAYWSEATLPQGTNVAEAIVEEDSDVGTPSWAWLVLLISSSLIAAVVLRTWWTRRLG